MKIMHDLFVKYLNNLCSPDEVKQLLAHFNVPENEEILRKLITESLEKDNEEEVYEWSPSLEKSFTKIKNQINSEEGKVVPIEGVHAVPIYKKVWFRIAAAA